MSSNPLNELCEENITSRSDYRKWAKDNHPDKTTNANKHDRFVKITNYVNDLLPTNDSRVECEKQIPQQVFTNRLPVNLSKASCLRSAENWSKILKHHRFDKQAFDAPRFRADMRTMSPKMVQLLDYIRRLDDTDFNREGKYFKHFIFSDVKKGGYGAKIIASALVANGFNHCFTNNLNVVKPKQNERKETFGVLSSTAIYDRPFTQKHVRNVLTMYNERPNNIYGENMRFIVLDSGFKEGVDLFDVKYVHIFENQRNNADLIQAIGRATRSCGQKGLDFVPNVGWPLHVYQYYLTYEDPSKVVFDDYLQYAGVDLNLLVISENMEKLAIETAVDYDLNMNINKFENRVDEQLLEIEGGGAFEIGCNEKDKCGNRSTKSVPFSLSFLKGVYNQKLPKHFNRMLTKEKRQFFCDKLKSDPAFCSAVNRAYFLSKKKNASTQTTPKPSTDLVLRNPNNQLISTEHQNMLDMKEDMKNTEDMTFEEFQRYINRVFKEYKYKPIKVQNMCEMTKDKNGDERIVQFTESQNFVTNYFVPQHFAKGLLVWHSVGTGKTCTAISVKSFLYERMNYSVIWVTRNTLKEDIWKNMYDKICDHIIREKIKENKDVTNLKKYLSKRFLPPMSYRQFSNMLEGKNELYQRLVSLNGTEDILKNTLIIVDEAHKLYSKDLVALERPNMNAIEQKIRDSKSCKVMLMTGTPIADDPMEFVKLMNLLMKKNPFPTTLTEFKQAFMENNHFSKKGKREFQERTKGLISYLDRRFDPRQFAQPKFYKVPVTMSVARREDMDCMKNAESKLENCLNNTNTPDETRFNHLKDAIYNMQIEIEEMKGDLTLDKLNDNLKNLIKLRKSNLKDLKAQLMAEKKNMTRMNRETSTQKRECKKEFTKDKKECDAIMKRQQDMYQNMVFQKC